MTKRIVLENISKRFRIGFKKHQGTLARLLVLFSGKEPKMVIEALKDISFSAEAKEIIGIIGENGSGKSTLLRTIAGIYIQDQGKIYINGRVISLIGLNFGLKSRLTMKDNIYLCCSLFGLSQEEIKKSFGSIVEFAGLEDFVNTKLYQFSWGMVQRLVLSIVIYCNPDILLLDEAFAELDEDFRIKSADKIKGLVNNGVTVLFASHEMGLIEQCCNRVIWIDRGQIVRIGKSEEVIKEYLRNEVNK